MATTKQFKSRMFNGQFAIEGYSAVLNADGLHIALIAPNLDILDTFWQKIHVRPVDREKAQHVLIVKCPKEGDADGKRQG